MMELAQTAIPEMYRPHPTDFLKESQTRYFVGYLTLHTNDYTKVLTINYC